MKITTILSDLGNVVVHYDNQPMYETFARMSGKTPQEVEQIFFGRDEAGSYLVERYSLGHIDSAQFRFEVLNALGVWGVPCAHTFFVSTYCDVFTPNQPVIELWERLRRNGLILTAVTNIEDLRYRWLLRVGTMSLFDHEVLSFEERLVKPSEEFMMRALKRSGCNADEAVYVDDLEPNLAPAAKLGIHTHLYRDFDGLEAFLRGLGVPA